MKPTWMEWALAFGSIGLLCCVIVAAGHGICPAGLFLLTAPALIDWSAPFAKSAASQLLMASLFTYLALLLITYSFFIRNRQNKRGSEIRSYVSIACLLLSFILIVSFVEDRYRLIPLVTGLPFLACTAAFAFTLTSRLVHK